MNKYGINELEGFQHPYEIDYSSMKSSKNDSLKIKANRLKENKNNLIGSNDIIFRNSPNLNSINSLKSLQSNNHNYRLNKNIKKNLENYIESNKGKLPKKNNKNKIKSDNNALNKKTKNKISNNINIYSKINKYWESRDKKNKIKMQKIKKEREQKIYGELCPIPKISKNTKEIIERLKDRNYELTEEDEYEEEINKNIPIKTKEKNYFFKTVYYSNKNKLKKKNKINKSVSKIYSHYEKDKLNKISKNKIRAKTPKLKTYKSMKKMKLSNKKKLNLSIADIKNLEMIKLIRKKEEDEKLLEIQEKIKEEEIVNSQINKGIKNKKDINLSNNNLKEDMMMNYLNKSMNTISMRNYSNNLNNFSNIYEIMTSRKFLNDIYNKDKKIINHSFVLNSSSIPNTSQTHKINRNDNNNSSSNYKKSKTLDNKRNSKLRSTSATSKSKNNSKKEYGLYDPKSKTLRYRHYTEISNSYTNSKFNNLMNIQIENDNNKDNETNKNNSNDKEINIMANSENNRFSEINKNYIINKLKNNLCFEFDREIKEKDEEVNEVYKNEIKHQTNEIKKIEIELNERNMINKKLVNEANVDDRDFKKIILKNESINNKFNEMNSASLLKFREENLKKLAELRQKGNKCDKNIIVNIKNEEEKNVEKQFLKNINSMKYKSILNDSQQKIENNLELYNNELKINDQKKKALLNKIFGNDYSRNIELYDDEYDINNTNYEYQFGINKYLIKTDMNIKENFSNKYFSNKSNNEIEKEDNEIIVENFDFQRRHHF